MPLVRVSALSCSPETSATSYYLTDSFPGFQLLPAHLVSRQTPADPLNTSKDFSSKASWLAICLIGLESGLLHY